MVKLNELTPRQAAKRLDVSLYFVYHCLWAGKLPGARKAGKTWRIPAKAVEARLKQREARNG
jgi:excisionase family DNA binding protein